MLRRAVLVGSLLVIVLSGPASAVEVVTINSVAGGFQPPTRTATVGERVRWVNNDGFAHTATGRAPLSLWNRSLPAGQSAGRAFAQAGTFPYFCQIHPSMTGLVRVPIVVTPASGPGGTTFTVRAGSAAPPAGFRYVIQRKRPGVPGFTNWRTINTATTTFVTTATTAEGVWRFRSRLRRVSNGALSGFSPVDSITLT
jgi:plastocyanin